MALSDFLAPSLQVGSTILSAGGDVARGQAARTIASRRRVAAEFEAQQLEKEAEQSRGLGMRGAQDETLKAKLVESQALARAAASGAGASDPTVMNIIAKTAGEGAYRSAVAMYEGEAQARLDVMKAQALRYEGAVGEADARVAQRFAGTSAAATLLSGGAKALAMYDKYWSGPTPSGRTNGSAIASIPAATSNSDSGSWLDAGTEIRDLV